MRCPRDKQEMIILELHGIELDYCVTCKGVWFDSEELELLIGKLKLEDDSSFMSECSSCSEKPLKCPICRKKMQKVEFGKDSSKVIIDKCRNCGLWFDGGEIIKLTQHLEKGGPGNVTEYIRDFFGE